MVVTFLNESLVFEVVGKSAVLVSSSLDRATCPSCSQPDCVNDCDGSQGADDANLEEEYDAVCRQRYNAGVDTVESLILALVGEGVLFGSEESRAVNNAIQSCLDALGQQFLG
jgi:hypothetical protein